MNYSDKTYSVQEFKEAYSYQVFTNYIGKTPPIGKAMLSPLRVEKNPSFSVFKDESTAEYIFKDHGSGESGDCIKFVQLKFNLVFKAAIELLQQDYNCSIGDNIHPQPAFNSSPSHNPLKPIATSKTYELKERTKYNQQEADYYNQYNIKAQVLKDYNVFALDGYVLPNGTVINRRTDELIFCYKHEGWAKIYKPNESNRKFRFQHLGNKPQDFIFGYDFLAGAGGLLIITGGEKDVLTLVSLGFNAISLNSETATIPIVKAEELKARFNEIIVLYDTDDTGLTSSEKLCKAHGFKQALLPKDHFTEIDKDISDYVKKGYTIDDLNIVLENAISFPETEIVNPDKYVYNAVELLALGNIEPDYLLSPILPRIGTAVIAGKPDTGKSQFARQFCIQVATGLTDFLGFNIDLIHKRALYISTEDSKEATSYLLSKQLSGLGREPTENLKFIFGDILENYELLKEVEDTLKVFPVDILVVDCFGDVFSGSDSNNNNAMRNTVRIFSRLSSKYNCLILFVHHINKGGYSLKPGQEHIQGGSGLVQKVRLAIQLSEGEGNTRYFTVVKGNYCPKEYKQNSIELEFSEDSFLFSNTGNKVPTTDLGTSPNNNEKDEKYSELTNIADEIFDNKTVPYGIFVEQFCNITGKSIATAKRAHANLKKLELIDEYEGGYRLIKQIPDPLTDSVKNNTLFD